MITKGHDHFLNLLIMMIAKENDHFLIPYRQDKKVNKFYNLSIRIWLREN